MPMWQVVQRSTRASGSIQIWCIPSGSFAALAAPTFCVTAATTSACTPDQAGETSRPTASANVTSTARPAIANMTRSTRR